MKAINLSDCTNLCSTAHCATKESFRGCFWRASSSDTSEQRSCCWASGGTQCSPSPTLASFFINITQLSCKTGLQEIIATKLMDKMREERGDCIFWNFQADLFYPFRLNLSQPSTHLDVPKFEFSNGMAIITERTKDSAYWGCVSFQFLLTMPDKSQFTFILLRNYSCYRVTHGFRITCTSDSTNLREGCCLLSARICLKYILKSIHLDGYHLFSH